MGDERRRWPRLKSELGLDIYVVEPPEAQRVLGTVGSDLNPEGIFVRTDDPPPLGARVRITLVAEGTEGVLSAEGQVVDRVLPGQEAAGPPGVGIRLERTGAAWGKFYRLLVAHSVVDS